MKTRIWPKPPPTPEEFNRDCERTRKQLERLEAKWLKWFKDDPRGAARAWREMKDAGII